MSLQNECLSSGESEPEEATDEDLTGASNLFPKEIDDSPYIFEEITYDSHFFPSVKDFVGQARIRENIPLNSTDPCDYFEYFFDATLFQNIIIQTNLYREQVPYIKSDNMKDWEPVTEGELRKFIGLSINMGHVRKGDIKDYWSTDFTLSTPVFGYVMSRDRYIQILRSLYFSNNEESSCQTLRKIQPIIDHVKGKFANTIHPGRNLCIDESLLLWKGRLRFKQYLPLKRNRFGIKNFQLVDCETGFILGIIVYTGSDTDLETYSLGVSGDVVATFMRNYFYMGHVVFIDNWYSSPILAEFLHDRDTGMCGTVKKNRKGLPVLKEKLDRGECEVAHTSSWLVMKWQDKKEVYMITTVHQVEYCTIGKKNYKTKEDIIKPIYIHDYNRNMGGIDNIDRQLSLTETVRKTMRWYRKLFFHLIDLMLSNARVLFQMKTGQKISFPDFRLCVVKALLNIDGLETPTFQNLTHLRLNGKHFPNEISNTKYPYRRCALCCMSKVTRKSKYQCQKCLVTLCITPCFEIYHTKTELP